MVDSTSGSLADTPLSSVLLSLAQEEKTGALRLGNGGSVWFDNGKVYLAQSPGGPQLTDVIFGADVGSLAEVSEIMSGTVSSSAIEHLTQAHPERSGVLQRLLHEYNLTAMFELLVPSDQTFLFDAGVTHRLGSEFAENTSQLLSQAERRLEIWRQIAAEIPNTSVVFKMNDQLPNAMEEKPITNDEWGYLSMLDGQASVADVITATGESAFRVCSGLYRLLLEDLIHEVEEDT